MQPLARPAAPSATSRDPYLWEVAKRRTKFQDHLLVYMLVNAGLWVLYFVLPEAHSHHRELPWPVWTSAFWGFGVLLQGLGAYSQLNRGERTQREYERLVQGY